MATVTTTGTETIEQRSVEAPRGGVEGVGSPISNEAYNIIAALQAKLQGLEAYRKYAMDSDGELWCDLSQVEMKGVEKLVGRLEKLVSEGKFRMALKEKAQEKEAEESH